MLIYIAEETRRVMINPDPRLSRNPTSDSVWLGVPTWFEAGNEGSRDEAKACFMSLNSFVWINPLLTAMRGLVDVRQGPSS